MSQKINIYNGIFLNYDNKIMAIDKNIKEILTRGVDEVIDKKHLEAVLASGKKLRIKLGIDPTGAKLHLGYAVTLWKLRALQDLGHQIVFIIGDFTGLIGDTSDKESERPMLEEGQVAQNMKDYLSQVGKILDVKKLETRYNSEWLKPLNYLEISKQADQFGLHEFIVRDIIARRMEAGKRVSLREVLYPLMQGYDSVAVKSDLEFGGIDQRFNILAGRTLQKYYNQEPQGIIIVKYLTGTDGRKMSKSWGNVINITDEPNDMFGKVMAIEDKLIIQYFELATLVPLSQISEIEKDLVSKNPRDIKAMLATEIVGLYHGEEEAKKARKEFDRVFSKRENPEEMKEIKNKGTAITTIMAAGIVESNSELKRLIQQKAVKINDKVVELWEQETKSGDIIKIGPRKFLKVK